MAGGYINMNKQVKMTSCGKTENNHVKLSICSMARELMQNFRQISLIGLKSCFPVAHLGNTAWTIDIPVILFL